MAGALEMDQRGAAGHPKISMVYILSRLFHQNTKAGLNSGRYTSPVLFTILIIAGTIFASSQARITPFVLAMITGGLYLYLSALSRAIAGMMEFVQEKETKIKVFQQIYGLPELMYWLAKLIDATMIGLSSAVLLLIGYKLVDGLLPHASGTLLTVWAVLFEWHLLAMFSFLSTPFERVETVASMGLCLIFPMLLIVVPTAFLQVFAPGLSSLFRGNSVIFFVIDLVIPMVGAVFGYFTFFMVDHLQTCAGGEDNCHKGVTFQTIFATEFCNVSYSDISECPEGGQQLLALSPFMILVASLCSTVVWAFLAWYCQAVYPKEYGVQRSCCFLCSGAYWKPQQAAAPRAEALLQVEEGGQQRMAAIHIQELVKEFKGKGRAVDGLSLTVLKGELFALLGHNGAGKTTTINILVGMMPATSGTALVNGYDIGNNIDEVRKELAFCPQDNPLLPGFTISQHLKLFGSFRGLTGQVANDRTQQVLQALGMPEKLHDLCIELSGGQKRRLWVATALLADTALVFLDEPTSGMDPSSRRELWTMLRDMRSKGKSITFTTHYLEEADILADRKAVMARGKIMAVGTSHDLKRHYGTGYHLQVSFTTEVSDDTVAQMTRLIQTHIPTANLEVIPEEERTQSADVARMEYFLLPFDQMQAYGALFAALDAQTKDLKIDNYNLNMVSLEEIFLKLGMEADQAANVQDNVDFEEVQQELSLERSEVTQATQIRATLRFRLISLLWNSPVAFASCVLLPAMLILSPPLLYDADSAFGKTYFMYGTGLAFSGSITYQAVALVSERIDKCKYSCIAQGLTVRAYWIGVSGAAMLPLMFFTLLGLVAGIPKFFPNQVGALPVALGLVFAGPASWVAFAFTLTNIYTTKELAGSRVGIITLTIAVLPNLIAFLWTTDGNQSLAQVLHVVLSFISPGYALGGFLNSLEFSEAPYYASWCAVPVYGGFVNALVLIGLLIWTDSRSYDSAPGLAGEDRHASHKDEDVLAEERRVQALRSPADFENEAVCLQGLVHTYRTNIAGTWKENQAVRGVSFGVRRGECMGVLGPNGAGKTTTVSVMTGLVRPPTAGKVYVQGCDMSDGQQMNKAFRNTGLCPQEDCIWEFVAGKDHILYYGRIKGVPENILQATTDALIHKLGLPMADAILPAGKYSGGMKRKLCIAMALIGQPSTLFLDEPSAGVDAAAKRHLWKVIKMRLPTQSVILTTHSMEEAEALCDRIAIQVKGQIRAIGSPYHIKDKYTSGYQLEMFCEGADAEKELLAFLHEKLTKEVSLKEHHMGRYVFQLPRLSAAGISFGKVFQTIQEHRAAHKITDYSLTQPTLEQVFIRFAREQDE